MLIKVDLGQLPFDTFAADQPTDHFALTRYNDRISSVPQFMLGHLSTFIMPSFGPEPSIHIVSQVLSAIDLGGSCQLSLGGSKSLDRFQKKVKILDFLNFGQRRLGTPVMVLVDREVVGIGLC